MATPPFKFKEQADQAYYHDVRVFIMGQDVTPWLMGSVQISKAGLGGMNQVSLTLSNHNDAFEITVENLEGRFRTFDPWAPQGMSSEAAKKGIFDLKNGRDNGQPRNFKHTVKSWGPRSTTSNIRGKLVGVSNQDSQSFNSTTDRFPFVVGSTVFHKNDQIRVFVKNPFSRFYDQWYLEFSGYLTSHVLTQDYVRGESIVRVQAQDIRTLMQKMRVQVNPSAQVGNENLLIVGSEDPNTGIDSENPNAGYFNDMISNHAAISHVLGGKSFTDTVNFLLLGKEPANLDLASTNIEGSPPVMLNRVAKLQEGVRVNYDVNSQNRKNQLERFTNVVIFGQDPDFTELDSSGNRKFQRQGTRLFLDWEDMFRVGRGSHPWGEFSVDAGRVHLLLPKDDHPMSSLISFALTGSSINDKISWASRLELLYEVCNNIDYQMYVSGWGDIIFEFPMYDFDPGDFNPAYEKLFTFEQHIKRDTVDDEGGEEVSGLIVSSDRLAEQVRRDGEGNIPPGASATHIQLYTTIFSNVLASRIGVQLKTVKRLGITDQNILTQFGFLEFNKIIAEYSKYSFESAYRPFLTVNRPILAVLRDRLGKIENFTNTWQIRGDVSTELDLRYVRRREHLRDASGKILLDQPVFRSIVGGEATPISYNKFFTDQDSIKLLGAGSVSSNARRGENTQEGTE